MKNKVIIQKESEVSISQNFCDFVKSSIRANILESFDNQWYYSQVKPIKEKHQLKKC
jgi:hypothetical protein